MGTPHGHVLSTPGRWVAAAARSRDPGLRVTRRAVRAAVFVPVIVALGRATGNRQVAAYSAIGAICLLLVVGFAGRTAPVLRRQIGFCVVGAAMVCIGTLCSVQPVLAVIVTAVVAFAVSFVAILGPVAVQASAGVLVLFLAPVSQAIPLDQLWSRLAGLGLAAAIAVPASMLVLPGRRTDDLRDLLARASGALADLAEVLAAPAGSECAVERSAERADVVARAHTGLADLDALYRKTAFLPVGVGLDEHAAGRLVGYLTALGLDLLRTVAATPEASTERRSAADRQLYETSARALRCCAALLRRASNGARHDPADVRELTATMNQLTAARLQAVDAVLTRLRAQVATPPIRVPSAQTGGTTQGGLNDALELSLAPRALGRAMIPVIQATAATSGVALPGAVVPAGPGARIARYARAAGHRARPFMRPDSVWFRNSLRIGLALALAVLVVQVVDVPHGFWITLGAIAALRSSAADTTDNAVRAVGGTALGVAAASGVLWLVGETPATDWVLLPLAVLVAGLAVGTASFQAGQAAFSFTVIVLLRVLDPTGHFGWLRLDNVAIGCAVALGVGLLCWPRGASRAFGQALSDALARIVDELQSVLARLGTTRVDAAGPGVDAWHATRAQAPAAVDMIAAFGRLDDALRQYLSERHATALGTDEAAAMFGEVLMARVDAELIDQLTQPGDAAPEPPLLEVATAVTTLMDRCREAAAFYEQTTALLRRPDLPQPPLPPDPSAARPVLRASLIAATRAGRHDQETAALQLVWICEALHRQRPLQGQLLDAVNRLATRP